MQPYKVFANMIREFLRENPSVPHELYVDDGQGATLLEISKADESGFDVSVLVQDRRVALTTERGFHDHQDVESDLEKFFLQFIGYLRDILSPQVRLRERCAGGGPYHWTLEVWDGSEWRAEHSVGLLLFKFWGRRSENIYQNRLIRGLPVDWGRVDENRGA